MTAYGRWLKVSVASAGQESNSQDLWIAEFYGLFAVSSTS
jgi:hypothetical protein